MKLNAKQMQIAQSCSTPEELVEKAKSVGLEVSAEEAQKFLDSVEMVELNEEELENTAGGCGTTHRSTCYYCGRKFDHELTRVLYGQDCIGGEYIDEYIFVCPDCL